MTTKPTEQQLTESDVNDFESSLLLAVDGKAMVRVSFAAALIRDWRAMKAENEGLKSELFEYQPIMKSKPNRHADYRKQARQIASRFTEKFCRAAPLAATGEFNSGLQSSVESALNSATAALREQLANVTKERNDWRQRAEEAEADLRETV